MSNNQKQQNIVFPYVQLTNLLSFLTRFPKSCERVREYFATSSLSDMPFVFGEARSY